MNRQGNALLITPHRTLQLLMQSMYASQWSIYSVHNGVEAIRYVQRYEHLQVIIFDISVDDLSWKEMLRVFRTSKYYRHIPVILVGISSEADEELRLDPSVACVPKPFDPVLMSQFLDHILLEGHLKEQQV